MRGIATMGQYTDELKKRSVTISPEDDDYEAGLLETARLFRNFGEALQAFLKEYGFINTEASADECMELLKLQFCQAQIPVPRNLKDWFERDIRISRDTAFVLCFALELEEEAVDDFFRRVYFERSFDCHRMEEAVYYYCIRNALPFGKAREIIEKLPVPKQGRIPGQGILYTEAIERTVKNLRSDYELFAYLERAAEQFSYHHATAVKFVRRLWEEISKEDDAGNPEHKSSTWMIYARMLGMDRYEEKKYGRCRSLTQVLENNQLLPFKAKECFPARQSIEKILRGEPVQNETVRKTLILLVFYRFWEKLRAKYKSIIYEASLEERTRCFYVLNKYLADAGYQPLYPGNAYDWIFLWALNDVRPLEAFHSYIGELFAVHSEVEEGGTYGL